MMMFLVSKCCAGIKCRYRHNGFFRKFLKEIGEKEDYIAVCPETLGGLKIPREGCSIDGRQVIGRKTGKPYTKEYIKGANKTLEICKKNGIKTAYLLKNSPSCGKGYGLTAKLLEKNGIEVIAV
jgi:uncharacterized protein YbbK (DUF523 family)